MSPEDIVTIAGFLAVLFIGMLASSLLDARRSTAEVRIRARMRALQAQRVGHHAADSAQAPGAELFRLKKPETFLQLWLQRHRQRLFTVSGRYGAAWLAFAAAGALTGGFMLGRLPWLPGWSTAPLMIVLPLFAVMLAYRALIERFRVRFLSAFPDTLDMVIRAVRAGVPVTQSIATAGEEADEPVRSEFRIMGDALKLGIDLIEVLEAANARIQIADFAFFAVCLRLQRETGGQLTETLENLAAIIRMRRDIRLKTKALTAEGRLTSRIVAVVPFVIMGTLYSMNPGYIDVLFDTETGHRMLAVALALLVLGLAIVQKIARLDTSR